MALLNFLAELFVSNRPRHTDGFGGRERQIPSSLMVFAFAKLNQFSGSVRTESLGQIRDSFLFGDSLQSESCGSSSKPSSGWLAAVVEVLHICQVEVVT